MILPIYAYGQPVLKQIAEDISMEERDQLLELIADMWETMYNAAGIGLAAPQIGQSKRLFIVDTKQVLDDDDEEEGIKQAFINPELIIEEGELWLYEEGCLSIPKIRGDVSRLSDIQIKYLDEDFNEHIESFDGINARVIQHEYDHLEGILFTELLKPIKRRLINRRLDSIKKGKMEVKYKMKFIR